MNKIVVNVSGWFHADPDKIMFQLISDMDESKYITGTEWLELPLEGDKNNPGRDDYVIESVGKAMETALDGEYDYDDIEIE